MTEPDMNTCLCGCGELTSGTWKRGHWARGEGGYEPGKHGPAETPLPGPGDEVDLGELWPGMPGKFRPGETEDRGSFAQYADDSAFPQATPPASDDAEEITADPAPGPVKDRGPTKGRKAAAVRVTATTRRDIEAKFGLMLEIPGRIWATRDPYCGGTFVAQIPEIRAASVELICQSPDLVAWFTGVGGGFMLWLNLLTALQPVLYTAWAHHVAHAIEDPEPGPGVADTAQYAA